MNGVVIYFSGTGNTKYIANQFCEKINKNKDWCFKSYSIESQNQDFDHLIQDAQIVTFAYPIYASCVPRIMREFVQKHMKSLINKKVIVLCTQLMFSGDGARVFQDEFEKNAVDIIGAEHFNMPNNICNISVFKVTNKQQNEKIVRKATAKLERFCQKVLKNQSHKTGFNAFSKFMGYYSQRKHFSKSELSAREKVFINHDKCNLCAQCVKVCPMNNLEIVCFEKDETKKTLVAKGNCTLCYRCSNLCKKQALNVLINKEPIKQYYGI